MWTSKVPDSPKTRSLYVTTSVYNFVPADQGTINTTVKERDRASLIVHYTSTATTPAIPNNACPTEHLTKHCTNCKETAENRPQTAVLRKKKEQTDLKQQKTDSKHQEITNKQDNTDESAIS